MAFASLSSGVARMHLAQGNPQVTFLGEKILFDGIGCFCICYSAFTETGVTQTMKTNQITELKQVSSYIFFCLAEMPARVSDQASFYPPKT